jgi:hypothetical protein
MSKNEQNFESLKKLLKLKQHEVPPPGFFNNFSGQVISRIRAGEASQSQSFAARLDDSAPWLANFLRIFDTKPGLVGGFATSLCLLLLLTVVFAERAEQAPKNIFAASDSSSPDASALAAISSEAVPMLATAGTTGGIVASTNPVTSIQPVASLFGQPASAGLFQAQPASFVPGGQ